MFDTLQVAKIIKNKRILKNMTQMQLADAMEVSYQAVSNWERGNSMPDIAKLSELSQVLECSIEELLGNSKETETVSKLIRADQSEETPEEKELIEIKDVAEIVPLMQPERINNFIEQEILKGHICVNDILAVAPFVRTEILDRMAETIDIVENLSAVISIAPFLSKEAIDMVARKIVSVQSPAELCGLAPFVSRKTLDDLVYQIADSGDLNGCEGLYPFLSREKLNLIAEKIIAFKGVKGLVGIAPFL